MFGSILGLLSHTCGLLLGHTFSYRRTKSYSDLESVSRVKKIGNTSRVGVKGASIQARKRVTPAIGLHQILKEVKIRVKKEAFLLLEVTRRSVQV